MKRYLLLLAVPVASVALLAGAIQVQQAREARQWAAEVESRRTAESPAPDINTVSATRSAEAQRSGGSTVLVPSTALVREGEDGVVFVDAGDGAFESRRVQTGRRLGESVEIISGLGEGERVAAPAAPGMLRSQSGAGTRRTPRGVIR